MTNIISLENWGKSFREERVGVTIGNFDGFHLGHQKLLGDFQAACDKLGVRPLVFTFNPHPELFFNPGKRHLLTSYDRKYELIRESGLRDIVEISFEDVRELSGAEFASKHLSSHPGLELLWVGHDFTFGSDKAAPAESIQGELATKLVTREPFYVGEYCVSSTLIRTLLRGGEVEKAGSLLGRNFSILGKVFHGKKLGRKIGFPTINLNIAYPSCLPAFGVYLVTCDVNGMAKRGVMNVGVNPSVSKGDDVKWEVHLLDFDGDLYGAEVEIHFQRFIRGEKKFESVDELRAQIQRDILSAEGEHA